MRLGFATMLFLLGVQAAHIEAVQFTVHLVPVIQDHAIFGERLLALAEGNQCFDDSQALAEEISALGIYVNVNIECGDGTVCSADARDEPQYDAFVEACVNLNGKNYTYQLQCDFSVDIPDSGTQYGTFQWMNMVACFASVCNTTEVITAFDDGFNFDLNENGASFKEISCFIQDLTDPNGTVIVDTMEVYRSSANGFFVSAWSVLMTVIVAFATFSRI